MYNYMETRKEVFKESNQKNFLKTRDLAFRLIGQAGAVRMDKLLLGGDSWISMAYVDRLVELGEIREVTDNHISGQDRIFTR